MIFDHNCRHMHAYNTPKVGFVFIITLYENHKLSKEIQIPQTESLFKRLP